MLWRFTEAIPKVLTGYTLALNIHKLCQYYIQLYQSEGDLALRLTVGDLLGSISQIANISVGFRDAQIIHPLQNSPLVSLLQPVIHGTVLYNTADRRHGVAAVYWLAAIFEAKMDLYAALEAITSEESTVTSVKPSKMNRLQRSLVSARVAAVARDSTVHVSKFLKQALVTLDEYLRTNTSIRAGWEYRSKVIFWFLQYWWDTFELVTTHEFEESTFQAHLTIGENLFNNISNQYQDSGKDGLVISSLNALRTNFHSGFSLSTGLSMETLWNEFRPLVPSDLTTIEVLAQMEYLAIRFDRLKWKTTVSLSEISNVTTSFLRAYRGILCSDMDGSNLVEALQAEINKIEVAIDPDAQESKPYLAGLFDTFRKFLVVETLSSGKLRASPVDMNVVILSDHATVSEMQWCTSNKSSESLQLMGQIWQNDKTAQPMTGTFSGALLQKLNHISEVDMKSLKLLEIEIPVMGENVALHSGILCKNHLLDLTVALDHLLIEVADAHGDQIGGIYAQFLKSTQSMAGSKNVDITCSSGYAHARDIANSYSTELPAHFRQAFTDHLAIAATGVQSSIHEQDTRLEKLSLAWVHFAMGFIILYVPDREFDPVKRGQLECLRHEKMRKTLHQKLTALKHFEDIFSGQNTSRRCLWIETQIRDLGEWSEMLPEIVRPKISKLDQLQGEFTNLLTTVIDSKPHMKLLDLFSRKDEIAIQEIKLMLSNISKIIDRLSYSFKEYRDLTTTAISILQSLQLGLSLALHSLSDSPLKSSPTLALTRAIPFLGGGPIEISEDIYMNNPIEYLAYLAVSASTKDVFSFSSHLRQSLFKTVHTCYTKWQKQLDADRLETGSKSRLYRFRGSAEDEEEEVQEEFDELFPSYDNSHSETPKKVSSVETARMAAIKLAAVHEEIFLGDKLPSKQILDLIQQISSKVGREYTENWIDDQRHLTSNLLPGVILSLHDAAISLNANKVSSDTYNFYVDENLPEVRKLVSLIQQIQIRFHQLQQVDEISHMQPLRDVLESCRELLELRYTEPLAKIITKVEQVHKFMHEWQFGGWASRANSALQLYDSITSTIVNWRRLELSTWAKLFDMEIKKCNDDAKSWWFIAYQVVIAVPITMESEEELRTYSQILLKDLEAYFATAIIGQFIERLRLLKQLERHLKLLAADIPSMSIIHNAIANFISVYTYYVKPVEDTIKKGRVSLEKSMRDVLLLASWKDTNIIALRDSAKRSHHKLFKLVRKFRSLLGEPMQSILSQELPDTGVEDLAASPYVTEVRPPTINQLAMEQCKLKVPGWTERPKRFVNVSKTLKIMEDMATIPGEAVNISEYIESFIGNIITSSAELRKLTPSVLNDDNKVMVKHLKTRKRKLLADTLKELRIMGVKFNLSVDSLLKQDSTSKVLAATQHLNMTNGPNSKDIDYYFYKTLDLMQGVRGASRDHSEDLSSAEISRSIGFLEGLLQAV
ncbi:hypothetical protein F5884DRAFT_679985, partial [Xylogone sp. PMI_703]